VGLAFKEELMAKPYSTDLRERVMARVDDGHKPAEVARQFGVSERTVWDWLALRAQTGTIQPRQRKFGPDSLLKDVRERILQNVQEHPGLTLAQRQTQLHLRCCTTTLWKALKAWGITFKKSHASGRTAPSRRSAKAAVVGDSGSVKAAASARLPG
jgi:transposase